MLEFVRQELHFKQSEFRSGRQLSLLVHYIVSCQWSLGVKRIRGQYYVHPMKVWTLIDLLANWLMNSADAVHTQVYIATIAHFSRKCLQSLLCHANNKTFRCAFDVENERRTLRFNHITPLL